MASAQHLITMATDLLALTAIASDTEREDDLVDGNEVLQQVLKSLRFNISENEAQIICGPLPKVRIASAHLIQLLQNLLANALKYRKPEQTPRIEISAVRQGPEWIFAVADNGIGFDPAYAERIFGIFKRLHRRDEYPGTGIGLAICSRIVSAYGGRIWAEGHPGAGAIFRFAISAEPQELEQSTSEHPTKILVVEDNPLDLRMIRDALQQEATWAIEMEVAEDGEAAIHYLKQRGSHLGAAPPDVIVLDLNLPKRDGTEVLQMIRSTDNLRGLPVLIFSSSLEVVVEERVRAANVAPDGYIKKPSDVDDFLAFGGALRRFYGKHNRPIPNRYKAEAGVP
jgi:CheY-like chemotaxis protein